MDVHVSKGLVQVHVTSIYECESVVHVLWECPAYKDSRAEFMVKLRAAVGKTFKDFEALERASFVLGCELWIENFDAVLALMKKYIHNS